MSIDCPYCGKTGVELKTEEHFWGRRFKCGTCQVLIDWSRYNLRVWTANESFVYIIEDNRRLEGVFMKCPNPKCDYDLAHGGLPISLYCKGIPSDDRCLEPIDGCGLILCNCENEFTLRGNWLLGLGTMHWDLGFHYTKEDAWTVANRTLKLGAFL